MLRRFKFIGTLAFYVSLPALYFYLKKDERTRVIVQVDDKILVLKGWYGSNKWMLPGGGMHPTEKPAEAAVRELLEETGIVAEQKELQYITSGEVRDSYGIHYKHHIFTLRLPKRPDITEYDFEVCDSDWQTPEAVLVNKKGVLKATHSTLRTWLEHQNLV